MCDILYAGYKTHDSEDPYGGMTMTRYQGLIAEILEVFFDSKTEGILPKKGDVFAYVLFLLKTTSGQLTYLYIYIYAYVYALEK